MKVDIPLNKESKQNLIDSDKQICQNTYNLLLLLLMIYEVHTICFQTFFVWVLLLIVHT